MPELPLRVLETEQGQILTEQVPVVVMSCDLYGALGEAWPVVTPDIPCRSAEGHAAGASPGLVLAGRVDRPHHGRHPEAGGRDGTHVGPEDGQVPGARPGYGLTQLRRPDRAWESREAGQHGKPEDSRDIPRGSLCHAVARDFSLFLLFSACR